MAGETDLETLRKQRSRARTLRHKLDTLIAVSESRLALPLIGSTPFRARTAQIGHGAPGFGANRLPSKGARRLAIVRCLAMKSRFSRLSVSELTLRQLRNRREADLAPFGLRMDVFRFDGSFLSLAIDLPPAAVNGLTRHHLIRVDTIVEMEKPLEIFARLNIKHGPNTEQIVRELPLDAEEIMVEFDLAYSKLNEKRVERAWLDLIFEGPEMNEVILHDLTFSRRPRAEL